MVMKVSAEAQEFQCTPCMYFEQRKQEELLLATVGGLNPDEILQTIARAAPWFIVLRQATDAQKLSALGKLKRRLDFTSSAVELANGLAQKDQMAALLLLQNLATGRDDSLTNQAMEAFVASKCPSVKYKELFFQSSGVPSTRQGGISPSSVEIPTK